VTSRVEPLTDHDVSEFSCGDGDLDDWLRRHAHTARGQGTRTYVVVDDAGEVVGYFAITPHLLARSDAPVRLARGAPDRIPAILLAKLALDSSVQGRGLGSELLVVALGVIVSAAKRAGGRIVLVDAASDDAREFYERHDFERLPGHTHRLVMKLSSVANALGVPWP
jgi:GNAT superfamily N-acetyltransferase